MVGKINLPNDTHRIAVIGRTGSGKTYAGMWHLTMRRFDLMPWVIYDMKRDQLIADIPYTREIGLDETPRKPGIYIVRPDPDDNEGLDKSLMNIRRATNIGIYVDEGFMIGQRSKPFNAILTQGRSLHIPVIILSQRPVWLTRFVWSESEYFQVFELSYEEDQKVVKRFAPVDFTKPLPPYYSQYYDVVKKQHVTLKPVPKGDILLQTFEDRLKTRRTYL